MTREITGMRRTSAKDKKKQNILFFSYCSNDSGKVAPSHALELK